MLTPLAHTAQSSGATDRALTASAAFPCLARNIELSPYFVKLISALLGSEKIKPYIMSIFQLFKSWKSVIDKHFCDRQT
jgi:hypothetical protein